ncbi:hypothetical protein [Bacillus infantis]|uniref:hypothetical protein n=1 Tax=Bacillus infantis TaxID=324767 RepID=UPI003CE76443
MLQTKKGSLFVVTDEDNLYGECVGEYVWDYGSKIMLNIDTENVLFERKEVMQLF